MAETKRVIALGFFDGVHLGHAALMQMTKRRAQERGVTPAVLTFDTHPDTLVKGVEVPLINSPEGRAEIIRRVYGIESVIFIHFNRAVMQMPWQDFLRSLVEELHAVHPYRRGIPPTRSCAGSPRWEARRGSEASRHRRQQNY